MRKSILDGKTFGYLTVIGEGNAASPSPSGKRERTVLVRCLCNTIKTVNANNLARGAIKSCGCMRAALVSENRAQHGQARAGNRSPEFEAWSSLIARCTNPNKRNYHRYGGRGITVCERWSSSFENFYNDMGPRPSPDHSIDRFPNNDGNYEPGNCRWATREENARNKSNLHLLTHAGRTLCTAEWTEITGIPANTIRQRKALGWSDEEALTVPVRRKAGVS